MIIQLNTGKNIDGTARLDSYVSEKTSKALKHYKKHISRIEIHLTDQNADKGGPDDIQCKMEARIEGIKPVLVISKSSSIETATSEALDKMKASLGTIIGKIRNK